MVAYLVECSNSGNVVSSEIMVEAASDQEALDKVRALKIPYTCKVWDGDRLVGTVRAHC